MRGVVVVPLLDPEADHVGVSERALPYARALMGIADVDLRLVSVVDSVPAYSELHGARSVEAHRERDAWAADRRLYLESIAATFPEDRVATDVLFGDPAPRILDVLAFLDRPMLVMGSHARSGTARLLYGSVTFRLLQDADVPVLVVRRPLPVPANISLQRVMVPLDGSLFAEQVLSAVLRTLGKQQLHVHLLHVIDLARNPPDDPNRAQWVSPYQWAKQYLPGIAGLLEERGCTVSWEIRDGSVPEEIAAAADERDIDVVAMSTNSRGGVGRLVYGSVAESVLGSVSVPLLLVKPEETAVPFGA